MSSVRHNVTHLYRADARVGTALVEERLPVGGVAEVQRDTAWLIIGLYIGPDLLTITTQ